MLDELKKLLGENEHLKDLKGKQTEIIIKERERQAKLEQERKERIERETYQYSVIGKLDAFLNDKLTKDELPCTKTDVLTITTSGFLFDQEGYKYNAVILGDFDATATLEIDVLGIRYTTVINKGVNVVNLPNGAWIKADKLITVVLVRTNNQPAI